MQKIEHDLLTELRRQRSEFKEAEGDRMFIQYNSRDEGAMQRKHSRNLHRVTSESLSICQSTHAWAETT